MVWDYYRNNPEALAQLRAPVFEEKVVDHIIEQTKITERTVSREELMKVEDEDAPSSKPGLPNLDDAAAVDDIESQPQG